MKIKRVNYLDKLLAKAGIRTREKPGSYYLTKKEVLQMLAWASMLERKRNGKR